MIRSIFLTLLITVIGAACSPKSTSAPAAESYNLTLKRPKNVILMIGDGMGLTQITAGMYTNGNKIAFERCPVVGLHKCHSGDNLITDSAAGATAFACGVKTYNGAVGVDMGKMPVPTLLEIAEQYGLATGLLATCTVTHATPGSFIAHQPSRKMDEEIAADFLKTEVDIFIGGGKKYFDNRTKDERNLSAELEAKGYYVSDFVKEPLHELKAPKDKNLAYFTANDQPLPAYQGRDYLPFATSLTLDFLQNRSKKGFFVMIEGSQIDWGGHANNSNYIITEMHDFDKAVNAALDFAEKDGNTLVVITADHETGGYAINPGSTVDSIAGAFTTGYHTAAMIPVFAYGPGAESFSGIYENTAIFDKILNLLNFKK